MEMDQNLDEQSGVGGVDELLASPTSVLPVVPSEEM